MLVYGNSYESSGRTAVSMSPKRTKEPSAPSLGRTLRGCSERWRWKYKPERRVSLGDADSVVECQPESFVRVVTTLVLEEIGLDILENGEEHTARLIRRHAAARAGNAFGDGS